MADFAIAIEDTLKNEGGYVWHPSDPGGETNFGISKRTYPNVDIKALTKEKAKEIYKRDWWDKYGYGKITSQKVAGKIFDLSVNMGPSRAHRLAQAALLRLGENIKVDGVLGPVTIALINGMDEDKLLPEIQEGAADYYTSLNKPEFIKGWLNRAYA